MTHNSEPADWRIAWHDFLEVNTTVQVVEMVPELRLHLAIDSRSIFAEADALTRPGPTMPPYWAFAWPAGQAIARHILDHPHLVSGLRVVDIGSGSGIAGLAAVRAGARHVLAADTDPLSEQAALANARLNGLALATTTADMLGRVPDADLIIAADVLYEPTLAKRVEAFLTRAASAGIPAIVADRPAMPLPTLELDLVGDVRTMLVPSFVDNFPETARIYTMAARGRGRRAGARV